VDRVFKMREGNLIRRHLAVVVNKRTESVPSGPHHARRLKTIGSKSPRGSKKWRRPAQRAAKTAIEGGEDFEQQSVPTAAARDKNGGGNTDVHRTMPQLVPTNMALGKAARKHVEPSGTTGRGLLTTRSLTHHQKTGCSGTKNTTCHGIASP